MVVPLKLTQFYGNSLPRPRIYPDVKFNEQRVDPPPSVNEALISWASDAPWSMGGLSFKRLRTQGKVEGNVRSLRAFVEEDEEESVAASVKPSIKVAKKPADFVAMTKFSTRKEGSRSVEKKRKHAEEDTVEATPARKLRRKMAIEESDDEELPMFVPATEERPQKRGEAKPLPAASKAGLPSRDAVKTRVLRSPSKKIAVEETPNSMPAAEVRRKGKLFTASTRSLRGSKGVNSAANQGSSPASDEGRLTRSVNKAIAASEGSPVQPLKKPKVPGARKALLASEGESSDSDDGLEEFLKEKHRPLRRSTRYVKTEGRFAGSDSD